MIMDALRRLMQGRTAFVIAHRPTTLEGCDLWLHVEGGSLSRVEHREMVLSTPAAVTPVEARE